ncbi:winged helix-turn-helix transcriptional regulator [Virgibacillus halotolerans]|uniref:winged helix-turn-helix transcriptional regulator n=1 Tax=Virgibacillus halotolerans TaxID=1071053 RepID=UPI00195F2A5F|nr:helix-turn-helix domain-containing protein [Virgibacillus halotolerans]
MNICPYIEASFNILAKKWNGQIIHYLSHCKDCTAHFSEIKHDFSKITSRALSLKLSELADYELVEKKVVSGTPVMITYVLTEKGRALADALHPIQEWAQHYINIEIENKLNEEEHG